MSESDAAIRIPKAAELVADTLRRRIVTGEYDADELLPPEGTLMSTFNVARTKEAAPPSASILLAVSSAASASMSATTTLAPALAKAVALARPMPEPPPVTIAVRPVRSGMGGAPLFRSLRRGGNRVII